MFMCFVFMWFFRSQTARSVLFHQVCNRAFVHCQREGVSMKTAKMTNLSSTQWKRALLLRRRENDEYDEYDENDGCHAGKRMVYQKHGFCSLKHLNSKNGPFYRKKMILKNTKGKPDQKTLSCSLQILYVYPCFCVCGSMCLINAACSFDVMPYPYRKATRVGEPPLSACTGAFFAFASTLAQTGLNITSKRAILQLKASGMEASPGIALQHTGKTNITPKSTRVL